MKKAKIMLTTITVLAVVGAALAFKANKLIPTTLYCQGVPGVCTEPIERLWTTTIEGLGQLTFCSTASIWEDCITYTIDFD
jgi:hypothetical protein